MLALDSLTCGLPGKAVPPGMLTVLAYVLDDSQCGSKPPIDVSGWWSFDRSCPAVEPRRFSTIATTTMRATIPMMNHHIERSNLQPPCRRAIRRVSA